MIDWWGVFRNSLWILGLSIILATLSYADWWAKEQKQRFRDVIGLARFQGAISTGLAFFCAGLSLCSDRWWERGLWALFTLWFIYQAVTMLR
ncbi:MAG TPA: hypothetical protein ENG33_03215 [Chloroflexi bacterium]|nr:hypothetical protein [Chloroflexota bacterium]